MCLNSCECEGLEVCVTVRESLSVNMHVCQERGRVSVMYTWHACWWVGESGYTSTS